MKILYVTNEDMLIMKNES